MDEATLHLHIDFVPFQQEVNGDLILVYLLNRHLPHRDLRAALVEIRSGTNGYKLKKNSLRL